MGAVDNWWLDIGQWPLHRDAARIAELMVRTLHDVHHVATPGDIEQHSFGV
ncbi:hypothetical protein [Couchioplanes caeruleus]|uniref:Uncharacterized protein n=1 Tax=Couchioplanes caeruleus TaxID=56438 RepID=A0A3N1GJL1_9ACTN|nr:hypothetical protein [Couchioplanes caeruleus]ROP30460.1 hypothetical protein EDD30_3312 [Couchioplanes caeruleus]